VRGVDPDCGTTELRELEQAHAGSVCLLEPLNDLVGERQHPLRARLLVILDGSVLEDLTTETAYLRAPPIQRKHARVEPVE
jgi:hypothetical protein